MIYFLVFLSSCIYVYPLKFKCYKKSEFIIYMIPIVSVFVMLLALQENVGTDYYSYLSLADESHVIWKIKADGEYIFYWMLLLVRKLGNPQLIFLFCGILNYSFFLLSCFKLQRLGYKLEQFFFLYFTLLLIFFNQFNGIRQYLAIHIVIYAFFLLIEKKKKNFIILVVIASLIHKSAIVFLIFSVMDKMLMKKYNKKIIYCSLIIFFIISFIDLNKILNEILVYIPKYSNYIGSNYLEPISFIGRITKLLKIPAIMYFFMKIDQEKLNIKDRFLINMSSVAILIMLLSFTSGVIWRIYQYVDFFIAMPVLIYLKYNKMTKGSVMIYYYLIVIFIMKILLFPQGEYLYKSIL